MVEIREFGSGVLGNTLIELQSGKRSTRGKTPRKTNSTDSYYDVSQMKVVTTNVIRSFDTWAFKREQPTNPDLMQSFVAAAVASERPIPFVLYWGKGLRCSIDAPDLACLDYLASLSARVQRAYSPGASITLIFTDTHAGLNGHSREESRAYFDAVHTAALQRGFQGCWLGDVTTAKQNLFPTVTNDHILWEELQNSLLVSAAKWYRGGETVAEGARKYFLMNMVEKRAVELTFPQSIFITFNSSEFRPLFPDDLPIFYMYSLRRGVGVKPWFMSSDAANGDAAAGL